MYSIVIVPPALRAPFWSCWPLNEENASTFEEQTARAPVTKIAKDFMVAILRLGRGVRKNERYYPIYLNTIVDCDAECSPPPLPMPMCDKLRHAMDILTPPTPEK
jgi:hypothetical protein